MAYDDTNRGALFKNEQKESDNHPDYKGKVNVNGQDFWLSAWIKTAESGRRYMSLSVTPKEQPREERNERPARTHGDRPGGPNSRQQVGTGFEDDSDVPF